MMRLFTSLGLVPGFIFRASAVATLILLGGFGLDQSPAARISLDSFLPEWPVDIAMDMSQALDVAQADVPQATAALESRDEWGLRSSFVQQVRATSAPSLKKLVATLPELSDVRLNPQMRCLATAVYFESKGEPLEGQLAVAQVVLNRTHSKYYPKTVCGVVYQRRQFSFLHPQATPEQPPLPRNPKAWRRAKAIAAIAVLGAWHEVAPKALSFHATYVDPYWNSEMVRVTQIGQHIFYRMGRPNARALGSG